MHKKIQIMSKPECQQLDRDMPLTILNTLHDRRIPWPHSSQGSEHVGSWMIFSSGSVDYSGKMDKCCMDSGFGRERWLSPKA